MGLRILLIEDAAADAELITRELKASGLRFVLTRVETEPAFRHELAVRPPDLILSDHGLPAFSGFRALEIIREERPTVPFIFVSGSNDPSMVAQMYELGATDYVFKQDLGDLKTAVLQVLGTRSGTWSPDKDHPAAGQPELNLELPVPNLGVPVFATSIGHLSFCPECCKIRDETGSEVEMARYCMSRAEIVVQREICADCEQRSRLN